MARFPIIVPLVVGVLTLGVSTASASPTTAPEAKPVVTGLSLGSGTTEGGSELVVTGKRLDGVTAVRFGSTRVVPSPGLVSRTHVAVLTPAHSPGAVQVKIVTSHGTTSATAASSFRYFRPTAGTSLTWSAGVVPSGTQGGLVQTSCPAANRCVATDDSGNVSYFRHTSWTTPLRVDDQAIVDLSCPTTTFCMGVDRTNRVLGYDGTSWTSPSPLVSGATLTVSCSSATFCLAVTNQNAYLFYNGTSWTAPSQIPHPPSAGNVSTFDCSPANYCLALAAPASTDDNGERLSFNGTSWTDNGASSVDQGDQMSCPTARICAVFYADDQVGFYDNGTLTHVYSEGGSGLDQPLSLSCTSATFCLAVAVDDDDDSPVLQFNGTTWRRLTEPPVRGRYFTTGCSSTTGFCASASCATPTFCAVGAGNGLRVGGGVEVQYRGGTTLTNPRAVFRDVDFDGISCPAAKFCMTTAGYGVAATFDGMKFGTPRSASTDASGGTHVSCSSKSFCALTSGRDAALYNGTRWHSNQQIDSHRLTALGCGSAHLCAATDNVGRVAMFNGTKWTSPHRIDSTHWLLSVSCTGSGLCAALDRQGGVLVDRNGHWSARRAEFTAFPAGQLAGGNVSCASSTRCDAESDDGSVATYNGHRWLAPSGIVHLTDTNGDGLDTLSCTSTTFCLATGDMASYALNGSTWTDAHPVTGIDFINDLSCASKHWCLATNVYDESVIGRS